MMVRECVLLMSMVSGAFSAAGQTFYGIEWQTSLGGSLAEEAYGVCTVPTGYLVLGGTASVDGQVAGNHGGQDLWLAHIDDSGVMTWQRALGGTNQDWGYGVASFTDGGCAVVGEVTSNNGDVSGNHGSLDAWVAHLDPAGELIWQRAFGGSGGDGAYAVAVMPDSGLMLTGHAKSSDGDVIGHQGAGIHSDFWTLRLSPSGELLWQSTIGGSLNDIAHGLEVLGDGGAIVVGETFSQDGQVVGAHGMRDVWVCRLSPDGELLWSTALGGSQDDIAYDVLATTDGGVLVVGETQSNDGDVYGGHGGRDAWVIRLGSTGGVLWQRPLGGSGNDYFSAVVQASPDSYLIAGRTTSVSGNVGGNHGMEDVWLALIGEPNTLLWQACYGGSLNDRGRAMVAAPSGGYVLAGASSSSDGDVTFNNGQTDFWVARLGDYTAIRAVADPLVQISPNPAIGMLKISLPIGQIAIVSLVDMQGREALRATAQGSIIWLDVGDLSPGIFCVRIELADGVVQRVLAIE